MSAAESPSALLERAAAKIERLAVHFEAYQAREDPLGAWMYDATEGMALRDQTDWIRMLAPPVATSFVELLRDAARRTKKHAPLSPDGSTFQRCALDIARAVLGEHTEEDRDA